MHHQRSRPGRRGAQVHCAPDGGSLCGQRGSAYVPTRRSAAPCAACDCSRLHSGPGVTGSLKQMVLIWAVVFGTFAAMSALSAEQPTPQPTFGEFLRALDQGEVSAVVMRTRDNSVEVERARGPAYTIGYPDAYAPALVEQLRASDTRFDIEPGGSGLGGMLLRVLLPVGVLFAFWLLVLRRATSAGGRYGTFGRAPARQPAATARRPASGTSLALMRRWRNCERSPTSSRAPRGSRRWVPGPRRASCSTALRAPARRCSPVRSRVRRACRSSRSRARTSSRCSSAWAPHVCATCSSRPSRTRPHHLHRRDRRRRPASRRRPRRWQ